MVKTIMHVNNTLNIGGIENYLMNITKNIDLKEYNFKFLCYSEDHFDFEDDITSYGCKIIRITNPRKTSIFKHIKELKKVMKEEKVDIVESHTYFESGIVLLAAKLVGIKIRIAHSHTTEGLNKVSILRKMKWNIARILIRMFSTECIACSHEAGVALFGNKKFELIENGININLFEFNKTKRTSLRKQYNLSNDDIVIGHVGRFDVAKNHEFMIKLLQELMKKNNKFKLVLVGDGVQMNKIKKMVKLNNLSENVIFIGSVTDTYNYYNMFDLFIFPSIYEGLGMSIIEAQTNGLKCFASLNVPIESKITENVEYLDLTKIESWVDKILISDYKRNLIDLEDNPYNVKNVVEKLKKIYDKPIKK